MHSALNNDQSMISPPFVVIYLPVFLPWENMLDIAIVASN